MSLATQSLTQLRGIAQSFSIPDIFQKDKAQLMQAIELKQQTIAPPPKIEIPKPEYDARLMTKIPSRKANQEEIEELLAPFIQRGLQLRFTEEQWFMSHGKKNDQGTIRMPVRIIIFCARKIME